MPKQHEHDGVDNEGRDDGSLVGVPPDDSPGDTRKREIDDEQSKQIKRLNRGMLLAWIFGPGVALAAVVFTGLQWKSGEGQLEAANGQLEVMRAQLQDARDGAKQARADMDGVLATAKTQADSAIRQAESMATLAESNKVMAHAAQLSADNSRRIARANELSLQTAAQSVEATRRSVQVAQDIATAEQRAWLGVVSVTGKPRIGAPTRPIVTIVNSGRTPARNVVSSQFADNPEYFTPLGYRTAATPLEGPLTRRAAVMPGETFTLQFEVGGEPLTEELRQELFETRRAILFARISYEDIFERTHYLQFCYSYSEYRGGGSRYDTMYDGEKPRSADRPPYDLGTPPEFEPCEIRQNKSENRD